MPSLRRLSRPALGIAIAMAAMTHAMSGSAEEGKSPEHNAAFSGRVLGSDANRHDASACFIRSYDAVHLAQHPDQKVTRILVLLKREGESSEEDVSRWRFRFGVNLRRDPASYRTGGDCGPARIETEPGDMKGKLVLGCGVDCEGGGITVEPGVQKETIRVHLSSIRISRPEGGASSKPAPNAEPDDPDTGRLEGGRDDRLFLLRRTKITDCLALAYDDEDREALGLK
jgi:hypothetical protein